MKGGTNNAEQANSRQVEEVTLCRVMLFEEVSGPIGMKFPESMHSLSCRLWTWLFRCIIRLVVLPQCFTIPLAEP